MLHKYKDHTGILSQHCFAWYCDLHTEQKTEEEQDEKASKDDEDEEGSKEDNEHQGAEEYVFNIKVHASNGDNKEHQYVQGMCGFSYASSVYIACHLLSF
jgi:hypothetical protein